MLRIRLDINKNPLATIGVLDTGDTRLRPEGDPERMEHRYRVFDLFHSPPLDNDAVTIEDLREIGELWTDAGAADLVASVMGLVDDESLVFEP